MSAAQQIAHWKGLAERYGHAAREADIGLWQIVALATLLDGSPDVEKEGVSEVLSGGLQTLQELSVRVQANLRKEL